MQGFDQPLKDRLNVTTSPTQDWNTSNTGCVASVLRLIKSRQLKLSPQIFFPLKISAHCVCAMLFAKSATFGDIQTHATACSTFALQSSVACCFHALWRMQVRTSQHPAVSLQSHERKVSGVSFGQLVRFSSKFSVAGAFLILRREMGLTSCC